MASAPPSGLPTTQLESGWLLVPPMVKARAPECSWATRLGCAGRSDLGRSPTP